MTDTADRSYDPSTPVDDRPRTRQVSARRDRDAVPDGSVKIVTDWIRAGDDPAARATAALAAEQVRDRPRKGVEDFANSVLDAAEADGA